jgi:hypothetical protein
MVWQHALGIRKMLKTTNEYLLLALGTRYCFVAVIHFILQACLWIPTHLQECIVA